LSPADNDPEKIGTQAEKDRAPGHLRPLRVRGNVLLWSGMGVVGCGAGLLILTGLASSPWLFLLYPLLIGGEILSLGVLALSLLHRL
jgi:hypothetical protein